MFACPFLFFYIAANIAACLAVMASCIAILHYAEKRCLHVVFSDGALAFVAGWTRVFLHVTCSQKKYVQLDTVTIEVEWFIVSVDRT